ncbi:MAG TPA: SUMF1/EgtB/PvdO family nonheme iron enzyme [Armatimonadota bacterium]|jgi:formylglycine-generating enzyme required for sulfatase activity
MRIYICYTQEDLKQAQLIHNDLAQLAQKVFFDKESIPTGEDWERLLIKELKSSDAVVVLWSAAAARSPWVMRELSSAITLQKRIVTCMLDDQDLSPLIQDKQALRWDSSQTSLDKLRISLGLSTVASNEQKGPQSLAESQSAYRERIVRDFGTLRPLGRADDAPIQDLYLPMYLRPMGEQFGVDARIPAGELLAHGDTRAVILGRPGTGKSTTLRFFAYDAAKRGDLMPVYIRIAELLSTSDSLIDYVTSQLKGLLGRRAAEFIAESDHYCRHTTLLLLDGLDEISEPDRDGFRKRLSSFRTAQPDCRIVITSRYAGFEASEFGGYDLYELLELSPSDVELYVHHVADPEVCEQALRTIFNDSRLSSLASTPFLLAMMCAIPDLLGNRAIQRASLFRRCTRYLLKDFDWQDPQLGRPRTTQTEWKVLERALQAIAVRFFKLDVKEAFREEEILFLLRSVVDSMDGINPRDVLDKIIRYTGLLQRQGASIEFVHRSIWEFYVAEGMRDEVIENLVNRATIPIWEEPIRLYVGLTPEAELPDLLRRLWEQNKGLALRSMMELTVFPETILSELVNGLKRDDRVRLIAELEDSLAAIPSPLDKVRTLLDTSGALLKVERDCEVIYGCVILLERFAELYNSAECRDAVAEVLGLVEAPQRLTDYLSRPDLRLEFVQIPAGEFPMGCDDEGRTPDEKPEHQVRVSAFQISKYQVTNKLYYDGFPYATNRRDIRSDQDEQPVIFVTWFEAYVFARWLGCELPTEAEWEYACRASGRDDEQLFDYDRIPEYAWYAENSQRSTQAVGRLRPNSVGVFDMLGNVREWCYDWFDADFYQRCAEQGIVEDPVGPRDGTRKSLRGGCFDWNVANLVPTYRNYNPPDNSYYANGFRIVIRNPRTGGVATMDQRK